MNHIGFGRRAASNGSPPSIICEHSRNSTRDALLTVSGYVFIMPRFFFIAIALLATSACGSAPRCVTVDAKGIADANNSKAQFKAFLEGVIQRTVTAAMITKRDGVAGSQALSQAIDVAVGRHQAAWDRNIVASWNTLASDEIKQVCAAFASRDQATYMRFATRVGGEARKRNEPLLKLAASEVLAAVF